MGIWRNIGKIVILLYQIVYEQVKWYIGLFKSTDNPKTLNEISRIERYNEEQESIMRSKRMVELCEQPYYSTTNTKHEPE